MNATSTNETKKSNLKKTQGKSRSKWMKLCNGKLLLGLRVMLCFFIIKIRHFQSMISFRLILLSIHFPFDMLNKNNKQHCAPYMSKCRCHSIKNKACSQSRLFSFRRVIQLVRIVQWKVGKFKIRRYCWICGKLDSCSQSLNVIVCYASWNLSFKRWIFYLQINSSEIKK